MNEMFKRKLLFFCLAIAVLFVLKANVTFADPNAIDPSVVFTGEGDVPNPPIGEAGVLTQPVVIGWDDVGDLLPTSVVSIVAPSGLKFTNVSGQITGGVGIITSIGGTTTVSSNLKNDDTEISFNVNTPGFAPGEIRVGSDTALQLCPVDDTIMDMTESTGLGLTITVNGGTGNSETSTLGNIRLLNRPDIVTVDEISSTELKVMLKAEIGTVTVTNFYMGTSTDRSGGVSPSEVKLDNNDKTKVTLTIPNNFTLDFDAKPSVWIMGSTTGSFALVHNDDRATVQALVANGSTKPMLVRKSETVGAENPTVSIDNPVVGIHSEAVNESVNKAKVNIVSTSGQALKLKVVFEDDEKMNAPLDLDNVSAKVSGESGEIPHEDNVKMDTDELNEDILCIKGANNDGDIDVLLNFGAFGTMSFANEGDDDGLLPLVGKAKAIVKGDLKKLKIMVSPDDFMDKIGTTVFDVDKKGPEVVTSGDDKPVAEDDRQTIKLTFKEPVDPTSTEDKKDWVVTGSQSGALTTDSVEVDASTMTMVTIRTKELFQDLEKLTVTVREGTPTAVPGDKFFNPIFCATSTSSLKTLVDDIDAPDLSKPKKDTLRWSPTETGNEGVSDDANMVTVNIDAETSADLSRFVFQVFVVDNDDSLMIDFNQEVTDAFLGNSTTAGAGFDKDSLKEVSSGKYEGQMNLPEGKLNDGDKIILLCGVLGANDSVPSSKSDWEDLDPLKTEILCVDNTEPVVERAFRVDGGTDNMFMVEFDGVMNQATLRDKLPIVECGNDLLTVSGVDIIGSADDAEYSIFGSFPDGDECMVNFDPVLGSMVSDVNGNEMVNDDDFGVDKALILGEAPVPTTTTLVPSTTTTTLNGTSTTTTTIDGTTTTTTTTITPTTTTLEPPVVASISVDPTSATRSRDNRTATVTVLDQNGDPVPLVTVTASESGIGFIFVDPSSKITGPLGRAEFEFRFGFISSLGRITFTVTDANGDPLTATIREKLIATPPITPGSSE